MRRTHALRTCSTCRKRKVRCELPDVNVESSPNAPLSRSKACHRCRILNIDCFVDVKRQGTGSAIKASKSTRDHDPSEERGDLTRFSLFSVAPFSSVGDVEAAESGATRPKEASFKAEKQIFWRCLDIVALPLDLLQRLVNAQIQTPRWMSKARTNLLDSDVEVEDLLQIVTEESVVELQQK